MDPVSLLGGLPAGAPALPLDEAGKYVAGAYVVFLVLILVYVAIMAARLQRIEGELRELASFAEQGSPGTPGREAEDAPVDVEGRSEVSSIAPGPGSEDQSISVSSGPRGSRGGDAR
jgi:hypothetical protein